MNQKPTSVAVSSELYDLVSSLDLESKVVAQIMSTVSRFGDARWWDGYGKCKELASHGATARVQAMLDEINNL